MIELTPSDRTPEEDAAGIACCACDEEDRRDFHSDGSAAITNIRKGRRAAARGRK